MTDVKMLPKDFLAGMKELLGKEYDQYIKSYEEEWKPGLRVNTLKLSPEEFLEFSPWKLSPVPWTKNGFYYDSQDRPSRHPAYFAGLYYLQEPSAMTPAAMLPVEPGDKVLDVCAAPGGKSTELAANIQDLCWSSLLPCHHPAGTSPRRNREHLLKFYQKIPARPLPAFPGPR